MTHVPAPPTPAQEPIEPVSPPNPLEPNRPKTDGGVLKYLACPLCHTPSSLTLSAVESGGEWKCVRCGQQWDTARLAALANYALWVVEHDRKVAKLETDARAKTTAVH